jgi:hypothetical protein
MRVAGRGGPRIRAWSLGGTALALAVLIFVARGAVGFRARRRLPTQQAGVSLTPVLLPGPWWRRHRRWLTTPTTFTGTNPIVVNARTGAAYAWTFRGNRDGRGWFGVSTRWAVLHPGWSNEPWLLHYERGHAEPLDRPGPSD